MSEEIQLSDDGLDATLRVYVDTEVDGTFSEI